LVCVSWVGYGPDGRREAYNVCERYGKRELSLLCDASDFHGEVCNLVKIRLVLGSAVATMKLLEFFPVVEIHGFVFPHDEQLDESATKLVL
jgi:hypothetical protein